MEKNYYASNMQKVLIIAERLLEKGYGKLRIFPYISPSGVYWRCNFFSNEMPNSLGVPVSNWIQEKMEIDKDDKQTIADLSEKFEIEHQDFLNDCKGRDPEFLKWYKEMIDFLEEDELPYALSDYFKATDFWRTSKEREIRVFEK